MPQKLGVYWVTHMGVGVASMHNTGAGGATAIPWVDMQVGCTHVCSPIHGLCVSHARFTSSGRPSNYYLVRAEWWCPLSKVRVLVSLGEEEEEDNDSARH